MNESKKEVDKEQEIYINEPIGSFIYGSQSFLVIKNLDGTTSTITLNPDITLGEIQKLEIEASKIKSPEAQEEVLSRRVKAVLKTYNKKSHIESRKEKDSVVDIPDQEFVSILELISSSQKRIEEDLKEIESLDEEIDQMLESLES